MSPYLETMLNTAKISINH